MQVKSKTHSNEKSLETNFAMLKIGTFNEKEPAFGNKW